MTARKPVHKPTIDPRSDVIGCRIDNVGCNLPPDNEFTNAGIIELAKATQALAASITATAHALEEMARMAAKGSLRMDNCIITAGHK